MRQNMRKQSKNLCWSAPLVKFANLQTCDKKSAAKKCEAKRDVAVALHHREMSPNIKNADFCLQQQDDLAKNLVLQNKKTPRIQAKKYWDFRQAQKQ